MEVEHEILEREKLVSDNIVSINHVFRYIVKVSTNRN